MLRKVVLSLSLLIIVSTSIFGQDQLAARMLHNIIDISASYQGERLFPGEYSPRDVYHCDACHLREYPPGNKFRVSRTQSDAPVQSERRRGC